ncbi:hypothetical protein KL932_004083 [Ogataea haglerorum]|nr:hypothetical protein KL932_004083 [Ogataea haglerorum]
MGKWWFHLFESVVVPEHQDVAQLVGAVNVFISQSTRGDMKHRFRLVRAFAEHVKAQQELHDALYNVLDFFQPFLAAVEETVAAEKKVLDKQVKEVILLASWKDINVDALKQSSRKSHQSLYKLVRRYRDVLSGTVADMIESGLKAPVSQFLPKTIGTCPVALGDLPATDISIKAACRNAKNANRREQKTGGGSQTGEAQAAERHLEGAAPQRAQAADQHENSGPACVDDGGAGQLAHVPPHGPRGVRRVLFPCAGAASALARGGG